MKSPKSKTQKNKERKIGEKRKRLIDSTGPNMIPGETKWEGGGKKDKCSRQKIWIFQWKGTPSVQRQWSERPKLGAYPDLQEHKIETI